MHAKKTNLAMNNLSPIGIFDSGVGGLSVVNNIVNLLPFENLVYVADSKYAPYGSRSKEEIFDRSCVIINYLIQSYNIKAIVVACNTATAACINELRELFLIPIIGMEPAIKPANRLSKNKRIGILATSGTLKSSKFIALLSHYAGNSEFFSQPCHGLVEEIEKGLIDTSKTRAIINKNLSALKRKKIDVIILGCTHFVFIRHLIKEFFNEDIPIIDTGLAVAKRLLSQLEENNLLMNRSLRGKLIICTNDDSKQPQQTLKTLVPDLKYKLITFN